MATPLVWFEVLGQHGDSLHGFYAELLGWQFDPRSASEPRKGPGRGMLERRGTRGPSPPPRRRWPAPWWGPIYTRASYPATAVSKAGARGSRVLVPPTRHGDTVIAVV